MCEVNKTDVIKEEIERVESSYHIIIKDKYSPHSVISSDGKFNLSNDYKSLNIEISESIKNDTDYVDSTYIHELLHCELILEGFPSARIDGNTLSEDDKLIVNLFTSAIQHPEIYRRMRNNQKINTGKYFDGLVKAQKDRIKKMQQTIENFQLNFIAISECCYYDSKKYIPVLTYYKKQTRNWAPFFLKLPSSICSKYKFTGNPDKIDVYLYGKELKDSLLGFEKCSQFNNIISRVYFASYNGNEVINCATWQS
jgi:hypothetical protein